MVFLSAFTTKTAVYVLLRGFPGTELLIYVGLFMVFYGIVYAILENDMRRILAYSIVNQVGFMVTGIGIGTELALNGAAAHAFAHIIYKALLLMSAGSVLYMTGKRKCTDLGGLFRTMPLTTICGIVGALSISSFPLTSGFVSKSMISEAAGMQHLAIGLVPAGRRLGRRVPARRHQVPLVRLLPEGFRTAAARSALEHAGRHDPLRRAVHRHRRLAGPALRHAAVPVDYVPYTASHVVFQLQLLLFSGLAFFLMLSWLKRTLTITLDMDWLYRRPARHWRKACTGWRRRMERHRKFDGPRCRRPIRGNPAPPRARRPSRPYLADGRHGILDDHHAGHLSDPVVPVIVKP